MAWPEAWPRQQPILFLLSQTAGNWASWKTFAKGNNIWKIIVYAKLIFTHIYFDILVWFESKIGSRYSGSFLPTSPFNYFSLFLMPIQRLCLFHTNLLMYKHPLCVVFLVLCKKSNKTWRWCYAKNTATFAWMRDEHMFVVDLWHCFIRRHFPDKELISATHIYVE